MSLRSDDLDSVGEPQVINYLMLHLHMDYIIKDYPKLLQILQTVLAARRLTQPANQLRHHTRCAAKSDRLLASSFAVKLRQFWAGAIQSDALSRCGFFVTWLVSIKAASLRFPSESATVMVIDAKRNANFQGPPKELPITPRR